MGSWGHVRGTNGMYGAARSRALGTAPGSLLSHFLVTLEPTAAERLDTAGGGWGGVGWGVGGAEGPGENRGSDQRILETPLPVPCSPREGDVTINKAFKQLMQAPKWLTLANTVEDAGSSALWCSKLSPEKTLYKYTTLPERSPSRQSQGCSRAGHQAYVTSTVLLIGQK